MYQLAFFPFYLFSSTNGLCYNRTIAKVSESPKTNSEWSTATHQHTPSNIRRCKNKFFCQQSTSIVPRQPMSNFFIPPPKSAYKTRFLGARLGEILQTMSFAKSVPEGLNLSECERGIGGKNSPIGL